MLVLDRVTFGLGGLSIFEAASTKYLNLLRTRVGLPSVTYVAVCKPNDVANPTLELSSDFSLGRLVGIWSLICGGPLNEGG